MKRRFETAAVDEVVSIGTTTFCDARGKVTVRESTSGNITTVYDASCRNIGRHHER